jgi:hypothetical protein
MLMAGELLDSLGEDIGQQMEEMLAAGLANPGDREETGGIEASGGHTAESVKPLSEGPDEEPGEDGGVASPMFQSRQG